MGRPAPDVVGDGSLIERPHHGAVPDQSLLDLLSPFRSPAPIERAQAPVAQELEQVWPSRALSQDPLAVAGGEGLGGISHEFTGLFRSEGPERQVPENIEEGR